MTENVGAGMHIFMWDRVAESNKIQKSDPNLDNDRVHSINSTF